MIALESVTKRFGGKAVVDGLTFAVGEGEVVGFLGPNGAGKTTTLRMIAGFTTASEGRVTVAGHDMANDNLAAARHIGYLPERPPLYRNLDVSTYLNFVARVKGVPRRQRKSELDRVAQACRLENVFHTEIFKLSKGYGQRLGLAQAVLGKPEVLLLDEPTIGLDPGQLHDTREVIRSFGVGHTVMISTHILPEVTLLCQRVAIINHGRLVAIDTPSGLQKAVQSANIVTMRVGGDRTAIEERLAATEGVRSHDLAAADASGVFDVTCHVEPDAAAIEAGIARAFAGPFDLFRLERREPTLEDIFLYYIGEGSNGVHSA